MVVSRGSTVPNTKLVSSLSHSEWNSVQFQKRFIILLKRSLEVPKGVGVSKKGSMKVNQNFQWKPSLEVHEYFLEQPSLRNSLLLNRNRQLEWNWMWNIPFSSPEMSIWSYNNHQSSKQSWKGNHTSLQCQLIQTSQVCNIQTINPKTLEVIFLWCLKQSKAEKLLILSSWSPKKLLEGGLHHFNHKNALNIKLFPHKMPKAAKVCLKNVFYVHVLSFVLFSRFVDPYRRLGDSVCIQNTSG